MAFAMRSAPRKAAAGLLLLSLALALLVSANWDRKSNGPDDALNQCVRDLRADSPWYWYYATKNPGIRNLLPRKWLNKEHNEWSDREFRRQEARRKLSGMGTDAWPAVPVLLETLKSKNASIRVVAGWTLAAIKADEHPDWSRLSTVLEGKRGPADALRYILNNPPPSEERRNLVYRRFALIGLAATGPAVASVYSDVISVVKYGEDTEIRALAVTTAAKLQSERKRTVLVFKELLQNVDEWPEVRSAAALALADMVPTDPETRQLLQKALEDQRALVRLGAARALWRTGAPADEVLPVQTALLSHKLASVRVAALKGISEIGSAAWPIRSEVAGLTSDENESVCRSAAAALRSITGAGGPDSDLANQRVDRTEGHPSADGTNQTPGASSSRR